MHICQRPRACEAQRGPTAPPYALSPSLMTKKRTRASAPRRTRCQTPVGKPLFICSSSLVSVAASLHSHCNSVWSWLLLCHSHIQCVLAQSHTQTQTRCNSVKFSAKEILGERTDGRLKLEPLKIVTSAYGMFICVCTAVDHF